MDADICITKYAVTQTASFALVIPARMIAEVVYFLNQRRQQMIDLEFVRTIVSICSGIGTIGAAAGVLYTVYSHAKKPQQDIEKRVGAIETDIKDIKEKLDNDYSNIKQNREDTQLLMRSMFNLIENKITGNNVEGLKKTRDDLLEALTKN